MKKGKILFLIGILVFVGILLSGCGDASAKVEAGDNTNFIALVGNHGGSMVPTYSTCESAVMGACKAEGNVAVIVTDGDPYLATGDVIDIPKQQNNLSSSKLKAIYTSQTEQIMTLIKTSYAKTKEVDLLKALSLCAKEAKSSKFKDGSTEIYVYDSGVSTIYLNMTALDLEYVSADSVVSILKEKNMIPDLSGLEKIHWFNMGDTDYEISNAQINGMKKIWTAVIEAGGSTVEYYTDPSTNKFDVELPYVSKIPYTVNPINPDSGKPEKIKDIKDTSFVFTESQIGFNPGKSTFVNEEKASETFANVLEYLKEHTGEAILIAGTTADAGSAEYQSALSTDRATTVKNLFISEGIDEKRLTIIGLGSSSGFYKPDKNSDGSLDEKTAPRNRSIVIMDINSEKAVQILNGEFKRGEIYGS